MTLTLQILLAGTIAGFLLGMPLGPNGALCLYRSVRYGWPAGVATAAGCVVSVTLHSILSILFMNRLMRWIEQSLPLGVVYVACGAIMVIIGLVLLAIAIWKKDNEAIVDSSGALLNSFLSAMLVSFINPKNIIGFSTLVLSFSWLVITGEASTVHALIFGLGCFISVASLFCILIYSSVKYAGKSLQRILPLLKYSVPVVFLVFGFVRVFSVIC